MRLIDAGEANKAIETVCNDYGIAYGNKYGGFADKIASVIDNIPTIDAEPVVHGHWKNRKYRGIASSEWFNEWNCSKCGGSGCIRDKYCKHCGAKMDEEVKVNG